MRPITSAHCVSGEILQFGLDILAHLAKSSCQMPFITERSPRGVESKVQRFLHIDWIQVAQLTMAVLLLVICLSVLFAGVLVFGNCPYSVSRCER